MKWRDRISILSRKRNRRSVVSQPNGTTSSNLPSGSGVPREAESASNSASRESVETTLSQLRPVIGPDHKSYYILLRGNGDLFTCIQPAKNVIHSLDDMMKNVMSSVKSAKQPDVPTHSKRPRPSQTKTYSTSALQKHSVGGRKNGVGSMQAVLLGEGDTQAAGVHLEDVFVTREGSSGVGSVVQNVATNRTVPQVNSELLVPQRARTGIVMHQPTVQSRLVSQTSTNNNIVKQEPALLLSQDCDEESSQSSVLMSSQDLLRATLSAPQRVKKETSSQTKVTNGLEGHMGKTIPNTPSKAEASENSLSSVLASMGQNTLQELRLISKEGTVLTEQEIAAQIKILIETEQLIVGQGTQIIVLRVSEREVIVKLVLSEVQVKPTVNEVQVKAVVNQGQQRQQEQQQQQQQNQQQVTQPHSQKNFINQTVVKQELFVKEEVIISPSLSPIPEEDCFTQDVLVSRPHQDSDLDCFFSSYTEEKQAFDAIRGISLDPGLTPNCVLETLAEPLVDSLVNTTHHHQQQQDELEKLSSEVCDLQDLEESLLQGTGEIVVFQREDGTLVNQDGIPISSELQYLIASSQQDLTTSLGPDSQNDHILVPPEAFEDHTVDINCEL